MLVFSFNFQAAEDNGDDEYVVKREAFFDQKTGIIQHSGFKAAFIDNENAKYQCNADIKNAGPKRIFYVGFGGMAMKNEQVQKQQDKDDYRKRTPEGIVG